MGSEYVNGQHVEFRTEGLDHSVPSCCRVRQRLGFRLLLRDVLGLVPVEGGEHSTGWWGLGGRAVPTKVLGSLGLFLR